MYEKQNLALESQQKEVESRRSLRELQKELGREKDRTRAL